MEFKVPCVSHTDGSLKNCDNYWDKHQHSACVDNSNGKLMVLFSDYKTISFVLIF